MTYRPHRATGADANHFIPRDYLRDRCGGFATAPREVRGSTMAYTANYRGHGILLIDTSKYGGVFPDWYMELDNKKSVWIEIKTPEAMKEKDNGLTDGEKWMRDNGHSKFWIIAGESAFEFFMLEALS